jgi:hypothetical protein
MGSEDLVTHDRPRSSDLIRIKLLDWDGFQQAFKETWLSRHMFWPYHAPDQRRSLTCVGVVGRMALA